MNKYCKEDKKQTFQGRLNKYFGVDKQKNQEDLTNILWKIKKTFGFLDV